MENQQRQQIKKYLDLVVSRWKLIMACLLIATTAGLIQYLRIPKVYRASVLLSYEQQQINPARMAPEREDRRMRDTVSNLSEIVMSRNNLEAIIKQFNLYSGARRQLPIEDVIERMRSNAIQISPSSRGDTFTVTFQGAEQDKVMKVANALASKFIEENLKYREARATETSKYTEDELNMSKAVLDEKEQTMRDYKLKYYNEMAEQRESNMARLGSLNEQVQGAQESIQDLERTKVMLQEQLALRQRLARAMASGESTAAVADTRTASQPMGKFERLQQLQRYLDSLTIKYTEKHPEVRRTKQLIAKLQSELGEDQGMETGETASTAVIDPQVQQLNLQLKEIDLNIRSLREDQKVFRQEIEKYEQWIAAAPVREAEWSALTRDYNELRRHYDYLVAQNLQAASVEHLERKQKGSKFKIVDPARFPAKPFKPDFKKIFLMAIAVGLGLGVGLTVGLDFIDTSFKDADDLESYLGVAVVSSVPYIEKKKETRTKWLWSAFWAIVFFVFTVALLAALAYFWKKGQIIL